MKKCCFLKSFCPDLILGPSSCIITAELKEGTSIYSHRFSFFFFSFIASTKLEGITLEGGKPA